jgi:hypothetical protein
MNEESIEVINIIHQVLRQFMVAMAATNRTDLDELGNLLAAASANESLDPAARAILADLAAGAAGLHASGVRKQ